MKDQTYLDAKHILSEKKHRYGDNVHLLNDPLALSELASLCSPETQQPRVNDLISSLYTFLFRTVISHEFPTRIEQVKTRMAEYHPNEGFYAGPILDKETRAISVNLARAGTLPSHLLYSALNHILDPKHVRQDHISIARKTNEALTVTGSEVSGHKVGGSCQDAILMFPDPMGATGNTIVEAIDLYKPFGKPKKIIALHCIVTPEYLKKVLTHIPNLIVYALRLDRGLSSEKVLHSEPGTFWDEERGLNSKQYIVPGGGGLGEVLNNAYV